jgi:hypothetical protein
MTASLGPCIRRDDRYGSVSVVFAHGGLAPSQQLVAQVASDQGAGLVHDMGNGRPKQSRVLLFELQPPST